MKKKILVVGANSFIGRNLINRLIDANHEVCGVYNNHTEFLRNEIVNIPVKNIESLEDIYDEVYLLSASINTGQQDKKSRSEMFETNVELVGLICNKFQNSRIVYASSVSVYKTKQGVITENDNEGGLNEYGVSKIWGEKIVQQTKNYGIVRFSSVYGEGMKLTTIIPAYIQQAFKNNSVAVWGDGSRKQNYIHVTDAVQFLIKTAAYKENKIFLATAAESISNIQLATMIATKTAATLSYTGSDQAPSFIYDNKNTVETLQFKASVKIEDGIDEVIKWIKEND